ncbi:hypothetical protein FKN01_15050 [Streptomyces sp. 130]|uniref:hypothetical protein n=1 Tax=Streptomyces sp. 130 TaxID=2591006 RepID=UPI00117CFF9A|nr:hypothetical protein [Streptomyces sp. 130]TRV77839.1 hypothetical protein FKN01_15050 [Streptomyces sp. 130]
MLPSDGGEPWTPGRAADRAAPAGGRPWGQEWGPQDGGGQGAYGQQQPYQQGPHQGAYGQQPGGYGRDQGAAYGPQQGAAPLPPAQQPPAQPQPYAQPLPPEAGPGAAPGGDADATQYIAPIPGGPAPGGLPPARPAESTRFPGGDADATQYIAPIPGGPAPGGLPPESPAESTRFLGRAAQAPQGGGGDAEATQYLPPVPGGAPYGIRPGAPGERQPPAEFDNLFRSDEPEGATQQMPRFDPAQQQPPYQQSPPRQPYQAGPPPQQGFQQPPPYSGPQDGPGQDGGDGGRRKKSGAVPLIAAVVVGCAVIGLGAGALMSGGDDDKDAKQPVASASSPAAGEPSGEQEQPPADPAKPQAEELDKLLADSNNSRAAVIGAVEKTKSCSDLDTAVSDLKGAAKQRRELVTRLQALAVDKLPDHDRLTAALTTAWQASASADDHYAAWAVQAKSKKVCKHGHAKTTSHTQQATVKSGEASKAKREAAELWNKIAQKYGLTTRQATAL